MAWTLAPLVELPFFEIVPYPEDWNDPRQRERWDRGRADALAVPFEDLVGSGYVPASRLTTEAWRRVLAAEADDAEDDDDVRINGGLGLFADDMTVLLPGYCIWIDEATEEWRRVAELPPGDWSMLWIGHPWVLAKRSGGALAISQPTESNDPEGLTVLAEIPVAELGRAFDNARSNAARAVPRLADALTSLDKAGHEAARRALGLGDAP